MRIPYFLLVLIIVVLVVVVSEAKKNKGKGNCHGCNNHHGGNYHGGNQHGGNYHGGNYHGNKHHGGYHHKRDVSGQEEPSPKPTVVVDISIAKGKHENRRRPSFHGNVNPTQKPKGQVVPIKPLVGIPKSALKAEPNSVDGSKFGPVVGALTKA